MTMKKIFLAAVTALALCSYGYAQDDEDEYEEEESTESVAPAPAVDDANGGNIVKSPIVGTYYRSPSPDKPPFVKVGDKVKKGDVIMIIESMQLMNEVQSEFDGVVERILVSDGQAVEFDQPIMIIK